MGKEDDIELLVEPDQEIVGSTEVSVKFTKQGSSRILDKSKPTCHVHIDLAVEDVNVSTQQFTVKGHVRFVMSTEHPMVQGFRVETPKLDGGPRIGSNLVQFCKQTFSQLKLKDPKATGFWHYDMNIYEDPSCGAYFPVNTNYMFYNSLTESEFVPKGMYYCDKMKTVSIGIGMHTVLAQKFHLINYPWDTQVLGLKLNTREKYWNYVESKSEYENANLMSVDQNYFGNPFQCRLDYSVDGYVLVGGFADFDMEEKATSQVKGSQRSKPLYSMVIKRKGEYAFRNFIEPLCFLMLSVCLVLFTDPVQNFTNRLAMLLTTFLALVGMKYVLIQRLPESNDTTQVEKFIHGMFKLVFILAAEAVVVYLIGGKDTFSISLNALDNEFNLNWLDALMFALVISVVVISVSRFRMLAKKKFTKADLNRIYRHKIINQFQGFEATNKVYCKFDPANAPNAKGLPEK